MHCYNLLVFTLNVLLQKISILPHHPLTTWKVYQFTSLNLSLNVLTVFFRLQDLPPRDLFNDRFWCADWTVSGNIQFYLMLWGLGNFLGRGEGGNGGKYASEVFKPPPFLRQNLYILFFNTLLRSRDLFWGPKYNTFWRTSPLFLKFGVNELF